MAERRQFFAPFLMSSYFTKWGINHTLLSNFFGFYYFINAQVSRGLIFFPRLVRLYLLIQDLLYDPFLTWSGVLHAWLCVSWIKDHKNNLLDALIDIIEIDFLNGKTNHTFFLCFIAKTLVFHECVPKKGFLLLIETPFYYGIIISMQRLIWSFSCCFSLH